MQITIAEALQQAVAAHKEGKLQDAERLYRAILKSTPSHPDANHNLGVLAVSVNKTDAALPLFKTALEANPKIEQFWLSYIDCLIKTERVDDARRVLSEAQQYGLTAAKLQVFEVQLGFEPSLSIDTPNQEFGNQLQSHQDELSPAVEFREAGKYQEAQEWLRNRIERDGKNAEALSLLSQVFLLDNKGSEAAEVLAEAASMSPELPSVYRNQARLFLKQSKIIEALEMAQLGCQHLPADPESLLVLAACLSANERDLEALPIIEELLEANSNYAEAYANRAIIKLRAKDTNGAIEDAEMSVSLKPHLTQMWKILSSLYQADNNLSDAIEALRNAHQNEPENTDLMIHLGTLLRQNNEAPEAIPLLEKATEVASKNASAWTNLGAALQQENRMVDAQVAYKKSLVLNPKSTVTLNNLGAIARKSGELASAAEYFQRALEIEPNLAEVHSNLGVTLKELGRLVEAEASYDRAIALEPNLSDALSNRSLLSLDRGDYESALKDADSCALSKKNMALPLISLYALGRIGDIYERLEVLSKSDSENISLAAFAAFISEVEKKPAPYNFCPRPMDFISVSNLSAHITDSVTFVESLLTELSDLEMIWEPMETTTVSGFQSPPGVNLLENPTGKVAQLKSIIVKEIESYYLKFKNEQCSYIQKFPTTFGLSGWTVTLKKQGYQNAHIHADGWLSGVIYLRVVPSLDKDEGAIKFGLNGDHYYNVDAPSVTFQPKGGDIVLFPSSLHHETIPFTTSADRVIISFDLLPSVVGC